MPSKANKKRMAAAKSAEKEATQAPTPAAPVEEAPQELTPTPPTPPTPAVAPSVPATRPTNTKQPEPPRMDPLKMTNPVKVVTNSYAMNVKAKTVYRYDVIIERCRNAGPESPRRPRQRNEEQRPGDEDRKPTPLAGSKGGDRQRQTDCGLLVKKALGKAGLQNLLVIYDGANMLFTTAELNNSISVEIASSETSRSLQQTHFPNNPEGSFRVIIEPNTRHPVLRTEQLPNECLRNMSVHDRSVTMMMQVALSQEARDNGFLVLDGSSQLFDMRGAPLRKDKCVEERDGVGSSVKIAEGADKMGQAQIVLDYKKTQFFAPEPLKNLPIRWNSPAEMRKYLKGLRVGTTYSSQVITISDISKLPIGDMYTDDGKKLLPLCATLAGRNVKEYNPDLRAIEMRTFNNKLGKFVVYNFPVENLVVLADQRLSPKHAAPPRSAKPFERFAATKRAGEAAHILSPNATLKTFGVDVEREPITVNAVTVPSPSIVYSGSAMTTPNLTKRASWEVSTRRGASGGLVTPSTINKLLILFNSNFERNPHDAERKVHEFSNNLASSARNLGMIISSTAIEDLGQVYHNRTAVDAIILKMEQLKQLKEKPVVVYADDSSQPTHDVLKLQERLSEVITQHVSLDKSLNKQGRNTMFNILLKINSKNGGFNHKVQPNNSIAHLWGQTSNTLIFSYDVCHASGKKQYRAGEICEEPSTVGFGFNNTKNPELVVGDFHFQVPRQEQVDDTILSLRARIILKQYVTSRGKVPDQIVVLRDGVSEGQYHMVLNEELAAIKKGFQQGLQELKKTARPKLALVIATKRHANRLYVRNANGVENVPPLTALDSTITRLNGNEVIFVSHCPLAGTAQPIVLNVLLNEAVFRNNDELVQFTAALCCTHQASTCIVSLPETIYAADEYAKRGAEMFLTYKGLLASRGESLPQVAEGGYDFDAITRKICYDFSPIFKARRIV